VDIKNTVVIWLYIIAFLYHCFLAHMANYERYFRIIIEDTVIEMYCRESGNIEAFYKWMSIRLFIVEAFDVLGRDNVHISLLFQQLRVGVRECRGLSDAQRLSCAALVEELEVNLLREFRLAGVNEIHILVSPEMFYQAITHMLEINGG